MSRAILVVITLQKSNYSFCQVLHFIIFCIFWLHSFSNVIHCHKVINFQCTCEEEKYFFVKNIHYILMKERYTLYILLFLFQNILFTV